MLISTRRDVPAGSLPAYQRLWARVREIAAETGARAWRFRRADQAASFIEFIEFDEARDPRGRQDLRDVGTRMDEISPGIVEEWRDATATDQPDPDT